LLIDSHISRLLEKYQLIIWTNRLSSDILIHIMS